MNHVDQRRTMKDTLDTGCTAENRFWKLAHLFPEKENLFRHFIIMSTSNVYAIRKIHGVSKFSAAV